MDIAREPRWPDVRLTPSVLDRPVLRAARGLLGARLLHEDEHGQQTGGTIVEVEAYGASDPASHSLRGPTPRNRSMFGAPGLAYVYQSYGIHWCLNVVVGPVGRGEAVLVRALRPEVGLQHMQRRRGPAAKTEAALCRGPGNVCRGMGISRAHDGADLLAADGRLRLLQGPLVAASRIVAAPRVGIRLAADRLWRLYLHGEPAVSSPRQRLN